MRVSELIGKLLGIMSEYGNTPVSLSIDINYPPSQDFLDGLNRRFFAMGNLEVDYDDEDREIVIRGED